jgi:hypothetical protein
MITFLHLFFLQITLNLGLCVCKTPFKDQKWNVVKYFKSNRFSFFKIQNRNSEKKKKKKIDQKRKKRRGHQPPGPCPGPNQPERLSRPNSAPLSLSAGRGPPIGNITSTVHPLPPGNGNHRRYSLPRSLRVRKCRQDPDLKYPILPSPVPLHFPSISSSNVRAR